MYAGDELEDKHLNKLYMIHPEFLDQDNNIILDKRDCVPQTGKAQMWILNERLYELHRERIKVGQKGYFMEGTVKTAECEVIELIGLINSKS
jgi:predicted nucleotidyltransferase